jgi:hypothetical protein
MYYNDKEVGWNDPLTSFQPLASRICNGTCSWRFLTGITVDTGIADNRWKSFCNKVMKCCKRTVSYIPITITDMFLCRTNDATTQIASETRPSTNRNGTCLHVKWLSVTCHIVRNSVNESALTIRCSHAIFEAVTTRTGAITNTAFRPWREIRWT